ncbi:MAG: hypothetical protein RRB13_11495 [bacterium]|nr:hypothetical protein [bacterium]
MIQVISTLLCDTAIQDAVTGKNSYIGVFERINAPILPVKIRATLAVRFKLRGSEKDHSIKLSVINPKGEEKVLTEFTTQDWSGKERAVAHFNMDLEFAEEGGYAIQVSAKEHNHWELLASEDLEVGILN